MLFAMQIKPYIDSCTTKKCFNTSVAEPYHKMLIYRLGRSVSAVCDLTYHMTFARLYFDVLFLSPSNGIKDKYTVKVDYQ